jgi:hypothetical protein
MFSVVTVARLKEAAPVIVSPYVSGSHVNLHCSSLQRTSSSNSCLLQRNSENWVACPGPSTVVNMLNSVNVKCFADDLLDCIVHQQPLHCCAACQQSTGCWKRLPSGADPCVFSTQLTIFVSNFNLKKLIFQKEHVLN